MFIAPQTPAPAPMPFARFCAWCAQPRSAQDKALLAAGAKVTHSICPTCEARMLAQLEEVVA